MCRYLLRFLEGETERLKERTTFFIILGCGYESDIHTALTIDLVLFDFWEYNLLGQTEGVVTVSVELLWR